MHIALLICTFNEESSIEARIKNLWRLRLPSTVSVNIHILDNGSRDETRRAVLDIAARGPVAVTFHELPPIGKCGALFWAFEQLEADYFLLSDANTVFDPGVVDAFVRSLRKQGDVSLLVGNFRSVATAEEGGSFFIGLNKMSFRLRLEKKLGLFTGANGGCYCVKKTSLVGIWQCSPVRNDDFIISVFAASFGVVHMVPEAKAYEVESQAAAAVFRQKYRDACGHHQAIDWIVKNCKVGMARAAVLFRLVYWMAPLVLALAAVWMVGWYALLVLAVAMLVSERIRKMGIWTAALYLGYLDGLLWPPTVWWDTER